MSALNENGVKTIKGKTKLRQLYKEFAKEHPKPIRLAFMLQDWEDPYNVGGLFRVAEACGAEALFMSGRTPVPPHPQIHVTSMGQHRRVPWEHLGRNEEAAIRIKEKGYSLVCVEIAEGAGHYMEFEYPPRTCLVLGNEAQGIYTSVNRLRDAAVYIPMYGKGRSLNVHVAAAVVAFEAMLRPRK
ncbi:MAG TPA: TrmH family RNA methyltransferase [Fimbriimonas sp.]